MKWRCASRNFAPYPPFRSSSRRRLARHGTTVVEAAIVVPVFLFVVLAIIEFARAMMVTSLLQSACRNGTRIGATEGTTTAEVVARVRQTLGSAIDLNSLTVYVNDASAFDGAGSPPLTPSAVEALPSLEVSAAEPRQLFVVRAKVDYGSIAIVPMAFMNGVVLDAQAFTRHE